MIKNLECMLSELYPLIGGSRDEKLKKHIEHRLEKSLETYASEIAESQSLLKNMRNLYLLRMINRRKEEK